MLEEFLSGALEFLKSPGRKSPRLSALTGRGLATGMAANNPMKASQIQVAHTRVFANGPGGGSPCPVIPDSDLLSNAQMQYLARKFGLDTVFILQPQTNAADIRLRYFVPDHEMGVSGHATIAAITVALLDGGLKSNDIRVETITGIFEVQVERREESFLLTLAQNKPEFGPAVDPESVASALNIDPGLIAISSSPIQSVSVSRAKLLVPLRDFAVLNGLAPNYEALWKLCDQLWVTGFYPFTRKTDKANADVEARQFPLRAGFLEDAATGVAAAALGAYLARHDRNSATGRHGFRIAQGYAMDCPSLIEALASCEHGAVASTTIRGTAELDRRESMPLP